MPIAFRFRRAATNAAVPAPEKGSNTVPPTGHEAKTMGVIRSSGKVAKCAPGYPFVGIDQTERRLRNGPTTAYACFFPRRLCVGDDHIVHSRRIRLPFPTAYPRGDISRLTHRNSRFLYRIRIQVIMFKTRQQKRVLVALRTAVQETLSGIAFGLCQTTSCRRYQPNFRNENANSHGTPNRSFGFKPKTDGRQLS